MITIGIIAFIIISFFLVMRYSPQFGGVLSEKQKEVYSKSPNFKRGLFINRKSFDSHLKLSFKDFREVIGEFIFPKEDSKPKKDISIVKIDSADIANFSHGTRLFWFGHSSFLLQIEDKNILIDPMFGEVPSPFSWLGGSRFNKTLPISVEELPTIDAVIISHDHYDHLDYGSIMKLKNKVKMFYTPLGVGVHLKKWGIEKERIVELDWWDEINQDNIIFRCVPSQHFSGRRLNTSNSTLWCSWIIKSETENIYFSGDGGYGDHFKEIGERFGPFDFAMMECGQYNEKWANIHMFPEQTAQAGVDLKAKQIMPIHWGAFRLSQHAWAEPVERVIVAADKLNLPIIIPKIGEPIIIQSTINSSKGTWWKNY